MAHREASPRPPLLIVGLGNPGPRYDGTRHNAGAATVSRLAGLLETRLRLFPSHAAWIARRNDAVLARPNAFMNECGPVVARLAEAFGVRNPIVVSDDMDLPLGTVRFRARGGSGGHKGLASIIAALGSRDFPRLKIGIGRPATKDEVTGYVLSRFANEERENRDSAIERAAAALRTAISQGLEKAMSELPS